MKNSRQRNGRDKNLKKAGADRETGADKKQTGGIAQWNLLKQ